MPDKYSQQTDQQNLAAIARDELMNAERAFLSNGNRLRTSVTRTLLATRYAYDEQPNLFTEVANTNGTVSYDGNSDRADLTIGTASGDKLYRSTNEFFHYQAYRETHLGLGFKFPSFQQGQRCRLGGFFEDDGIYFERSEDGDLYIVRRSNATGSVVEERVIQRDWNIDTMDGSEHPERNPTGLTLDHEKIQMLKIGFEWYGAGDAWLGFKINGIIYVCHKFYAGNNLSEPIFGEPTVPIRYEIENLSSVSSSATMQTWGASASAESGSQTDVGFAFAISRARNAINVGNTLTRVLTIRPKATYKSKTNRTKIEPVTFSLFADTNSVHFEIRRDTPITNSPTWQDVDPDSAVEYALDAQGTSGGFQRIQDYVAASSQGNQKSSGKADESADTRIPLVLGADGTLGDTNIAIFAQTLDDSTTTDVWASMRWLEIQ